MKAFLIKIIVSSIFLFIGINSFSCGYYPYDNEFRTTSFDANFINFNELNAFSFHSEYLNGDISLEKYNWEQNIDQWYKYCNSKSVLKADIFSALYKKSAFDSQKNSFIEFIKNNKKDAFLYLKELLNLDSVKQDFSKEAREEFKKRWDVFSINDHYFPYDTLFASVSKAFDYPNVKENIKKCTDPFVKKRWAYQAIISAFYKGN